MIQPLKHDSSKFTLVAVITEISESPKRSNSQI